MQLIRNCIRSHVITNINWTVSFLRRSRRRPRCEILSLISTHTFRLSPANLFGRKNIFRSHLKFKYFNFCQIFLQRHQSEFSVTESRGHFRRIEKFSQNGRPTAFSGPREDRPQYILKTRIIEFQASFCLRQFFAEL